MKKMNKGLIAGTVAALAVTTVLGGGITVLAATNDNQTDDTNYDYDYDDDYGYDDWWSWWDDDEYDYDDGYDYDYDYDYDYEEDYDYGSLTDDEINRLNAIYDRMWEISEAVYGEDEYLDDATYNERFAPYEDEWNKLDDEALDLEIKAGWYGDLTKEEVKHLFELYDQIEALEDEASQLEERAGFYN